MLRRKRVRRVVNHLLGFMTHCEHAMRAALNGDNAGLVKHNALTGYSNKRVRGAQVDCQIDRRSTAETAGKLAEEVHKRHRECPFPLRFLYV